VLVPYCLNFPILTRSIAVEDAVPATVKKSKKPKPAVGDDLTSRHAEKDTISTTPKVKKVKSKSEAKSEAKSKNTIVSNPKNDVSSTDDVEEESGASDDGDSSEVDDQTVALLRGFESDGDVEDAEQEDGLMEGRKVPKVPTMTNQNKKAMKGSLESDAPEKPGVVYVGHIPHGFYEHEMRAYFEQFGSILQLRLSRNRKSGASKHYAFIKFASAGVAGIVAKTMDKYLLFNHILKVKLIVDEQVPENLFKGANKRFKKIPWNKMAGRQLEQGASEATWEKRIQKEENRRAEKAQRMKSIGYEFAAPKIKSAKNVAKQPTEQPSVISNGEDEIKAIEAGSGVEELESKRGKKPNAATEDYAGSATGASEKRLKHKKSKTALADTATPGDEATEGKAKKSKRKQSRG
jgi:nucleolar protein 15